MGGKTDYDKLREKFLARQRAQIDDQSWFKPETGRYRVRILPPTENHDLWYLDYGVHYGLTNVEGDFETVTCPRLTQKQPCPICNFTKGLWRKNTDADQALARKFGAKKRYVSNVIVLSSSASEVKMWAYGPQVLNQLEEHCISQDGSVIPIDDPQKGTNMKVTVTQQSTPDGVFPNYIVSPESVQSVLPDMSVLGKRHDIVGIIHGRVRPLDELRSLLENSGGEPNPPISKPEMASQETQSAGPEEVIEETEDAPPEKSPARTSTEELVKRAREVLRQKSAK